MLENTNALHEIPHIWMADSQEIVLDGWHFDASLFFCGELTWTALKCPFHQKKWLRWPWPKYFAPILSVKMSTNIPNFSPQCSRKRDDLNEASRLQCKPGFFMKLDRTGCGWVSIYQWMHLLENVGVKTPGTGPGVLSSILCNHKRPFGKFNPLEIRLESIISRGLTCGNSRLMIGCLSYVSVIFSNVDLGNLKICRQKVGCKPKNRPKRQHVMHCRNMIT